MPGTITLINKTELMDRCMNDPEFAGQMLDVFIENSVKTVDSLKESLAQNHAVDSKRHAHTLKGSAGNLAMESLRTISATAEKLAAAGDLAAVTQQLPEIQQLLQSCIAEAELLKKELSLAA